MKEKMQGKILSFSRSTDTLLNISGDKYKSGDLESAVAFMLGALPTIDDKSKYKKTLKEISLTYQEMSLFDLSSQYAYYLYDCGDEKDKIWAFNTLAENYIETGDVIGATVNIYNSMQSSDKVYGRQTIDPEIIEAFSEAGAIPEEIVSGMSASDIGLYEKRRAELLFRGRNFKECIYVYNKVPRYLFDKISYYELAMAYFYEGDDGKAIKTCNKSLDAFGDNTLGYCALSNVFVYREDYKKSKYYYQKAKDCFTGNEEENFRLGMCALDNADHQTVSSSFKMALLEDKYNLSVRFLRSMALINLNQFQEAKDILTAICKIAPDKKIFKFYLRFVNKLLEGDQDSLKLLPLDYNQALPKKVIDEYFHTINKTMRNKRLTATEKQNLEDIKEWGVESEEDLIIKKALGLICDDKKSLASQALQKIFLSVDYSKEIKTVALYLCLVWSVRKKISLLCDYYCVKFSVGEMAFLDKPEGDLFAFSYALTLVRLTSGGVTEFSLVLNILNEIYLKYVKTVMKLDLSGLELSSIVIFIANYKEFGRPDLKKIFGKKYDEVYNTLLKDFVGERND